jgi:hypothetical protein
MMEDTFVLPLNPGDRVGTVSHIDENRVAHIFGYGVYEGMSAVGKEAVGPISAMARLDKREVPKVVLDGGNIIWGTECWIEREHVLKQLLKDPDISGTEMKDIDEVRVKAPKFLVVKFLVPLHTQAQYLPMSVCNETYQRMEDLERLGQNLRLEGKFIPETKRFILSLFNNKEEEDVEIVSSMGEPYQHAIDRIVERAHTRLIVPN